MINLDTLGPYMDPITHEITLNAVWTPFADNSERIETLNFFVNLNCEIADNLSNGYVIHPQSDFTDSLAFVRVQNAESLGAGHGSVMLIAPPEESSTAYEVDGELRSLTTTPYRGMTLETFPSDETIFEAIRNGGYTTPVLPSTGGVGTVMFTVGGIAIMVLAAFLFLRRKNKEN